MNDLILLRAQRGSEMRAKDVNGNTMLHRLVIEKDLKTIQKLIQEDIEFGEKIRWYMFLHNNQGKHIVPEINFNVNEVNNQGKTALHLSALNGSIEIVEILLQIGAKVDLPDNNGDTPLLLAARAENLELAILFLKNGASEYIRNNQGEFFGIFVDLNGWSDKDLQLSDDSEFAQQSRSGCFIL